MMSDSECREWVEAVADDPLCCLLLADRLEELGEHGAKYFPKHNRLRRKMSLWSTYERLRGASWLLHILRDRALMPSKEYVELKVDQAITSIKEEDRLLVKFVARLLKESTP